MLYPKNKDKTLSDALFENPTSEYRGAPFWAWNCELRKDPLLREIEALKEMGFGGFHMHPRVGMATPYLSKPFMDLVGDCVKKAKEEKMLAWLYDEDKWPSGFAGGLNTKKEENRKKSLFFTDRPYDDGSLTLAQDRENAREEKYPAKYSLLSCYDIVLDEEGNMLSYRRIGVKETAGGRKWFAYLRYDVPAKWYNGQTYVDTLSPSAIRDFIDLTHKRYKEAIGEEFGKTVPAIFSDEPQFTITEPMSSPFEHEAVLAFTTDFDQTFTSEYGFSILDTLPEVIFERKEGGYSKARYAFYNHLADRFVRAFADQIGAWCEENGLCYTGHLMREPSLAGQTSAVGDTMRSYRSFQIPGIDMLADHHELSAAKQCQSAVHQYGREGMLSELYGVTTWEYDFKGHKAQGDWQAAFGVSVRAPHLAWVSMKGEAKRDYPASIGYQSPWYREYPYIENHFARVNTVMTRGRPLVRIGLFYPIESFWFLYGPTSQTALAREEMASRHYELLNWLFFGSLDFDMVNESLLPELYGGSNGGFHVGRMCYDVLIVPNLITIRSTTLSALEEYRSKGGKILFMGEVPSYVDGERSDRAKEFAGRCTVIAWSKRALFSLLEENREVSLENPNGSFADNLVYSLREDGDVRHLFVSHVVEPKGYEYDSAPNESYRVSLRGEWKIDLLDTLFGERKELAATYEKGKTVLSWTGGHCDSLLLELRKGKRETGEVLTVPELPKEEFLSSEAPFTLEEPNVLLLDCPRYRIDDGEWHEEEEILRVGDAVREAFGLTRTSGVQPWILPKDKTVRGKVTLLYEIESEIDYEGAELALESIELAAVSLNGVPADMTDRGYYVDEDAIRRIALPQIHKGKNELRITYSVTEETSIESAYLLGDFGVSVLGRSTKLIPLPETLHFGSLLRQGLPFYSANVTYHLTYTGTGEKTLEIQRFKGSAISASVDGKRVPGLLAFPPNRLFLGSFDKKEHHIDITLYGNRVNTFGPLHDVVPKPSFPSPDIYRRKGRLFTYEYLLRENGILTTPRLLSK